MVSSPSENDDHISEERQGFSNLAVQNNK